MTQKQHDDLLDFTKRICHKFMKGFKYNPNELFYEAYSKNKNDIKSEIILEVQHNCRVKIAEWVNKQKLSVFQKKCGCCKKTKDSSEFYKRFCNKYNFWVLRSNCKQCFSDNAKQDRIDGKIDLKKAMEYQKKFYEKESNRIKRNIARKKLRESKKLSI